MPVTDTYIEKEAMINEEIDRLRHASTQALLTRKDVIIVASVSCIYGLGSPVEYEKVNMKIQKGMELSRNELIHKLIDIQFSRTNADITPGTFRAIGNAVEIMPVNERIIYRIEYDGASGGSVVGTISEIDSITRALRKNVEVFLGIPSLKWSSVEESLNEKNVIQPYKHLMSRIDPALIEKLINANKTVSQPTS